MVNRTFLKRKLVDFKVFFCFLSNTVIVNRGLAWDKYVLPLTVFCLIKPNKNVSDSMVFKFFDNKLDFWATYWKIISLNRTMTSGFFVEMELIGLGFRVRKIISSVYRFFWGHANFLYLFVPREIYAEYAAEERIIFFFSYCSRDINDIASYLMFLKKLSAYRVTGFIRPGKIIRLKSGKQR